MKGKLLFSNSPTTFLPPWEKDGEETKLAGQHGVSLIQQNFMNPGTQKSEVFTFCRKTPGMTVVPVLENGNPVITRTFKQGSNMIVWEFPAGFLSKDATAEDQASAQLAKETGLVAGKMISLGRACAAGPRKFDTYEDLFIAFNCTMGDPAPESGNILEVWEVTPAELWELIRRHDGSFSLFSETAAMRAADRGFIPNPFPND